MLQIIQIFKIPRKYTRYIQTLGKYIKSKQERIRDTKKKQRLGRSAIIYH